MNVLVTGATGQLGRKMTIYLLQNQVGVRTLGRKDFDSKTPNHTWSLGMSPNPGAFVGIDCVLHLAWSTKNRGNHDFHLNVGGSSKIIEASNLSRVRVINFSSLSAINPISSYGKAKKNIEEVNSSGLNLRIAKLEEPFFMHDLQLIEKILRKILFIPIPRGLSIQVMEMDQLLEESIKYINSSIDRGTYTLPHETLEFGEYLSKYHGLRSIYVPKKIIDLFFICCQASRTSRGKLLFDRWLSLVSTDQALRQKTKSF
jgi:hypothetical protein